MFNHLPFVFAPSLFLQTDFIPLNFSVDPVPDVNLVRTDFTDSPADPNRIFILFSLRDAPNPSELAR